MNRIKEHLTSEDRVRDRDSANTRVLDQERERRLLEEMASCRAVLEMLDEEISRKAREANADEDWREPGPRGEEAPRLVLVRKRYDQLRSELALANLRLVALLAKGFRNRGLS